jgi:S1-C subfamily serine protease
MQFITDILVTGLTIYITLTNQLATQVLALLDVNTSTPQTVEETVKVTHLPSLPSLFGSSGIIPDILLRSSEYQQAAVIGSNVPSTYTKDPLEALVNIYCTFVTKDTIRTTTGTGFFVHSDGVIITNAHVAQYLLLETTDLLGEADCVIRQGNPAIAKYRVELLYLPPAWIQRNAAVIDAIAPTGTGERDYALLYVSEPLNDEPLPARFPALAVDTELLPHTIKGEAVEAAGYPATDLIANGASTPLIPRKAETSITELYTFGSNYADVISIGGTAVGAEGSSGGPVINNTGKAIGIIVTRGDDDADGKGSLRAITLSHIERTILEETGFSLAKNISGNLPYRAKIFNETLSPFLINILATELKN